MSRFQTICPIVIALLAPSTISFAQEAPSANIAFSGGSVAAGVGYTWGSGTSLFKGKPHPFTASGLSVVDIGVNRIDGNLAAIPFDHLPFGKPEQVPDMIDTLCGA
jgi:hypothetical protein